MVAVSLMVIIILLNPDCNPAAAQLWPRNHYLGNSKLLLLSFSHLAAECRAGPWIGVLLGRIADPGLWR